MSTTEHDQEPPIGMTLDSFVQIVTTLAMGAQLDQARLADDMRRIAADLHKRKVGTAEMKAAVDFMASEFVQSLSRLVALGLVSPPSTGGGSSARH